MGLSRLFDKGSGRGKYEVAINCILVSLFVLNAADGVTTYFIMITGGGEFNPIVDYLIQNMGLSLALVSTRTVYALGILFSWDRLSLGGVGTYRMLWLALLFYISVVSMNIYNVVSYFGWV